MTSLEGGRLIEERELPRYRFEINDTAKYPSNGKTLSAILWSYIIYPKVPFVPIAHYLCSSRLSKRVRWSEPGIPRKADRLVLDSNVLLFKTQPIFGSPFWRRLLRVFFCF